MKLPTATQARAFVHHLVVDARKTLIAASAAATELIALGVLHGAARHDVEVVAGVVGAILVYLTPNGSKPAA